MNDTKRRKLHMTSAGFLGAAAGFVLLLFALSAGIVFLFDPFFVYHAPYFGLAAVQTDKEYQCVGALRNLPYDSIIVGSSVTENNNNAWFDTRFHCRTMKAVRSYGATADLCYLIDVASETHELRNIFYNIDPASLAAEPVMTFEQVGCPTYLYDKNPLNDYPYLFGKDILFEKIPYMVAKTMLGYDEGTSYNWYEGKEFSERAVLAHYARRRDTVPPMEEDIYRTQLEGNLRLLTAEIESHPETQFYFFFPPYSMLWWDGILRAGELDAYLYNEQICMETLLTYDNVRLYSFQTMDGVVTDLSLYMDTLHFAPSVNEALADAMAKDLCRIASPAAAADSIRELRTLIETSQTTLIARLEADDAFSYDGVF